VAALLTLQSNTPATSNAKKYAQIVSDYATRRRIIAASKEIEDTARNGEEDIDELMEKARNIFGSVEMPTIAGQPDDNITEFLDGDEDYDWLVPGLLERQDRLFITGAEGQGKALDITVPILTSEGWKTFADIKPAMKVLDEHGEWVKVVAVTDTMLDRKCYKIDFNDGSSVVADGDHLWVAEEVNKNEGLYTLKATTEYLYARMYIGVSFRIPEFDVTGNNKVNGASVNIVSIQPCDSIPVRCIQVESDSGLFRVGKNMIVTHNSTLLRQLAVTLSAGIHPFQHYSLPDGPVRVTMIDCENSEIQCRRKMRGMVIQAEKYCKGEYDPDYLRIRVKTDGLNLVDRTHVRWLIERIEANKPELLIIGPLYKLHDGDPNEEGPAKKVAQVFDRIRTRYGCALVMEAHSPYTTGTGGKRFGRPYGASLWSRWPEFGYSLARSDEFPDQFILDPWRGPRDEREWPAGLKKGGIWPWSEATVYD
jgi:hypothetical protein